MKKLLKLIPIVILSILNGNSARAELREMVHTGSVVTSQQDADDPIKGGFPTVSDVPCSGMFALRDATIVVDSMDFKVVDISAGMLDEDIKRVTGRELKKTFMSDLRNLEGPAVVAGTVGQSRLIDELIDSGLLDVEDIKGKWETFVVETLETTRGPIFVIAGSDRRGTAYGLTSMSRAIGVSPWYWWADVPPVHKEQLYVTPGRYVQGEPSVQYRGIFINDERFGGWALWVEKNFDKESGRVGPKVYEKVFELLLRLKGNYLWPAMHNGSKAFNSDPENARLADDYAIVMGSSHCEQMLRNNEDEWKNAGIYGDFNYLTNRDTMLDYWETRVKTNGKYENTYTLGLRGIHDYPMEGANTTAERTRLMQQAINDQREMLRRNIDKPLEEIPQVLCTYEEVLDAYHNGLEVPDDVTLLWCDDKHGYTRNLCNPEERKRAGGAGIYYHLSYHGDPASWIWLSPLSPTFLSNELTKAYTYGVKKIWVFNVGDIKPAEKELTFVMDLGWNIDSYPPEKAYQYVHKWARETFGPEYADEIAEIQEGYYRLQAAGKDAHVYFVNYPEEEIDLRLSKFQDLATRAENIERQLPEELKDAFFELITYPVKGAWMLNEYQLQSRRSLARAAAGDSEAATSYAERAKSMYTALNEWTARYNKEIRNGKWDYFFNWVPYHWYYSDGMAAPVATPELIADVRTAPSARFIPTDKALSEAGVDIDAECDGEVGLWIEALTPIRNFSKAREDNIFCRVKSGEYEFEAAATPINNVWHAPYIGPMWSKVGTLDLKKGANNLKLTDVSEGARVDSIYIGLYPPFPSEPRRIIKAQDYLSAENSPGGKVMTVKGLGYNDGLEVMPFDTPLYQLSEQMDNVPYAEYMIDMKPGMNTIEIRTLPTLHVYEGRDARYAVQVGKKAPEEYSIHADDFSAEWRLNVLRGYASRQVKVESDKGGEEKLRFYFLDPGIVLQEIRLY